MNARLALSAIFFISCGLFILCGALSGSATPSFRVGVIVPLSGPVAVAGNAVRNSIVLSAEKYDPEKRVEFIFEDDAFNPKNSVTAAQKLLAQDHADALIVFGSGPSFAVGEITEKSKIPIVSISTAPQVTKGKSFVVRHWLDAASEVRRAVQEIRARKYETIAVVSTENDGVVALRKEVTEQSPVKIVFNESFLPQDVDFRQVAARLKGLKPSAVYLLLLPPQSGIFAKQLREAGFSGELFGGHPIEIDSEVKRADGPLNGTWYVTSDDTPASRFYEEYRERFRTDPVAGAANGYDIAKLIINGSKDGDLNTFLHSVKNFSGAFGTYGTNENSGFDIAPAIKVICRGEVRKGSRCG